MGKKLRDEDLVLNVVINGDKAKKELGDLEQSTRELKNTNKDLRAEKEKLKRAGKEESDRYKEITALISQNNKTIKTNEARMNELRSEMGASGMTMKQLRREAKRLQSLLDDATYGTDNWRKYRAELDKVEAQMGKVKAKGKGMKATLGKIADGFNRFSVMGAAVVATLTGIVFSIKEWVNGMVTLDDALSDVMKTTGMTKKEVRELYGEFKNLNTRTSRRELLLLAEEAGRLGKKSKKDVMDFVEVANQITVALGDDLGDAQKAVKEVGKLTNIYKVGAQYGTGFKDSMSKIGSAINEVSANSSAQADFLIGYLKRMGGVADQSKVNAAEILGYASALDQLGQTQEMSATAHGKVMIDMFKDHGKYAEIAKMGSEEFLQLLKTDANEAFLKFLEGLNGNNEGMTVMSKKLDDLGVDGARAVQVLSALASNTAIVRREQDIANDAMDKGVSLMNEYNTKNENFAGSVAKIGQFIKAKLINSTFLGWIEKVVGKMAEWTKVPVSKVLRDQQKHVNSLTIEMTNSNTTAKRRNEIYKELQGIAPEVVKNIDKENISISTLRKNLDQYNMSMIKKLALQDSEVALEKERDKAGEATRKRAEEEIKLIEELQSLPKFLERFENWEGMENLSNDVEEIILSSDDLVSKMERIDELLKGLKDEEGNSLRFYVNSPGTDVFRFLKDVKNARQEEKEATDEVTKALEEYMAQYRQVFGMQKEVSGVGTTTHKVSTIQMTEFVDDGEADKEILADMERDIANYIKSWEDGRKKLTEIQKQFGLEEGGDQHTIAMEELQALRDQDLITLQEYEDAKKAIKDAYKIMDLEADVLEADNEAEKREAELILAQEQYDLEFAAAEGNRKRELKAKRKYEGKVKKIEENALNQKIQRLERERAISDAKRNIASTLLQAITTITGQETALGKIAFLAQQAFAVGQVWFNTQIANAKAVAASPLTLGQPWVGINTAQAIASTALIAAQAITGLESGGYTDVVRAQDGKPYRAQIRQKRGFVDKPSVLVGEGKPEFVANGDAVENPTVKPFLDTIDYHQRMGTIHTLDLAGIMGTMPSMRGYERGGYSQSNNSTPDVTDSPQSSEAKESKLDRQFKQAMIAIVKDGIVAKSYRDKQQELTEKDQRREDEMTMEVS